MSLTVASASNLDGLPGIRYGFFGNRGGVSSGIYESLNADPGSGDDPAAIKENRRRVAAALGVGEPDLVSAFQIFSNIVARVDAPWTQQKRPRCDAMVTAVPGIALGVLTADCGPVLFADVDARIVGAAHSGWKGALGGVLQNTVKALETLGAARGRIQAALGPWIRQKSYEVGPEFPSPFLQQAPDNERFFKPAARNGYFQFDLGGYIVDRLIQVGVDAVFDTETDTYPNADKLFSYRFNTHQGENRCGRNISAICLAE